MNITIERVAEVFGFTPGEWKWDGDVWDYEDVEEAPWLITKECPIITGQVECSHTNAVLISKSPELLHGLIELRLMFPDGYYHVDREKKDILEKLIESCDRQGRDFETLKGELLR